jgi:hypothetical protein
MTEDIVTRLRGIAVSVIPVFPRGAFLEAAAEIERLRAELEECRKGSSTIDRELND